MSAAPSPRGSAGRPTRPPKKLRVCSLRLDDDQEAVLNALKQSLSLSDSAVMRLALTELGVRELTSTDAGSGS